MRYKIYNQPPLAEDDQPLHIVATTAYPEFAAAMVSLCGPGATVRLNKDVILWTEGADGNAGESYDEAAETMMSREGALK